jgi:predicted CXXCH cytochrome family protein
MPTKSAFIALINRRLDRCGLGRRIRRRVGKPQVVSAVAGRVGRGLDRHLNPRRIFWTGVLFAAGLLAAGASHAQVETPTNPRSAKACAICHFRWIDVFFIDGRGTELVPYQSEKVVATPEMCNSCHDGSILDSRDRMVNGRGHRTGVAPPAGMAIPEIFPLDEYGKVQCATCHTAHGVPSGAGEETTIFMRTSNKDSAMCRMCHPGMNGGLPAGNHPMGTVRRDTPETLLALSAAAPKKKNVITCEICHNAHGSRFESFLIRSGRNAALCFSCHADKAVFAPDGRKQANHVINVKPTSAEIPDDLIRRGARLGYDGEIICQTCHKVHRNRPTGSLLLMKTDADSTLCLTCHHDQQTVSGTKHNLSYTAPRETNLQGRTVAEAGVCSACHLPHGAARSLEGAADFTSRLCLSCHGQGKIAANERLQGFSHPVDVAPFAERTPGEVYRAVDVTKEDLDLPLFSPAGVADRNGRMTCDTCHNPHRWRSDTTTGETRKDVPGDRTTSFLRRGSPEICRSCHDGKFQVRNSKHDLSRTAPQTTNMLKERPAEAGTCGSCHLVHGAGSYALWARELTVGNEFNLGQLCLSCHNSDGLAKEKLVGDHSHPTGIAPSKKGLTTDLPVYGPGARPAANGAMTCPTCHDPHRWDPTGTTTEPHDKVEGDARNSFLRQPNSPSPLICSSCHKDAAAVAGTDHDLGFSAPDSLNQAGQTPLQSGPCGVCHMVHNSRNRLLLWAREIGPGSGSIMNRMCRQCHSPKGAAAGKVPQIAFHPDDVTVNNAGRSRRDQPPYFPIFDDSTGKPVHYGGISCPSCHNAHKWSPLQSQKASGAPMEGNADNSFLRNVSYQNPCADCHGPEALFRYLYFHLPAKR